MGVRILNDRDENIAALYCSTSGFTFGPVFDGGPDPEQDALDFLDWLRAGAAARLGISPVRGDAADGLDPRQFADDPLETLVGQWRTENRCDCDSKGHCLACVLTAYDAADDGDEPLLHCHVCHRFSVGVGNSYCPHCGSGDTGVTHHGHDSWPDRSEIIDSYRKAVA